MRSYLGWADPLWIQHDHNRSGGFGLWDSHAISRCRGNSTYAHHHKSPVHGCPQPDRFFHCRLPSPLLNCPDRLAETSLDWSDQPSHNAQAMQA